MLLNLHLQFCYVLFICPICSFILLPLLFFFFFFLINQFLYDQFYLWYWLMNHLFIVLFDVGAQGFPVCIFNSLQFTLELYYAASHSVETVQTHTLVFFYFHFCSFAYFLLSICHRSHNILRLLLF